MTARNERLRERQKALGLEPVQTVLHPDDKAALLEFAFQLRVRRGTLTPADSKRVNDAATVQTPPAPTDSEILAAAIDDLPTPADSQILAALPVQSALVDPTIAQTKINRVAAVVGDYESRRHETSPRWGVARELLPKLREVLKDE
jgi:hypothetical protein